MKSTFSKIMIWPALLVVASILLACVPPQGRAPQSMISCDHRALEKNGVQGPALVSDSYGSVTDVPLDAVTVLDRRLYRSVMTQSLFADRTATGTTEVSARFINCTDQRIQMLARTNFLNAAGAPVEDVSAWKTLFLPPRSMTVYQERSFSDRDVVSYIIEIAPAG